MVYGHTNRRSFLKWSAAATAAAVTGPAALRAGAEESAKPRVRLGAPVFDAPQDPEGLALAHRKLGYRAAYCPNVGLSDKDRIRDLAAAFAKHDVVIAEVGRWNNLLDADAAKREANMKAVIDGLALADAIGARCCVNIAGSYSEKAWFGPHPKNFSAEFFDAVVENARKIIDAVKPTRAKLAWEMLGWAMPDSADRYVKMVKAIDRPQFGVHLDPCNAINCPEKFYDTTALLNECFDKLGAWIISCHAKDLTWDIEMNVHFREVPVGAGALDYTTYLKRLAGLKQDAPLMIEHMKGADEFDRCRKRIFEVGAAAGIAFE